jgi:hypothetical protein
MSKFTFYYNWFHKENVIIIEQRIPCSFFFFVYQVVLTSLDFLIAQLELSLFESVVFRLLVWKAS